MSATKYQPHVLIVPEDHADEQIANGFIKHDRVPPNRVQVMRPADGWSGVLNKFETQHIAYLRNYSKGHVVLLIDFDNQYATRRVRFDNIIPEDLKNRVFVIGVKENPELLKQSIGKDFEAIGLQLAEDCYKGVDGLWTHEHLVQNDPDRIKLIQFVKPIIFPI
jgi:hypothetical protein